MERNPVAGPFTGLVPDDVAEAYEKLLSAGRFPKEHAEDFLGGARLVDEPQAGRPIVMTFARRPLLSSPLEAGAVTECRPHRAPTRRACIVPRHDQYVCPASGPPRRCRL
jgi:hypothetical protein